MRKKRVKAVRFPERLFSRAALTAEPDPSRRAAWLQSHRPAMDAEQEMLTTIRTVRQQLDAAPGGRLAWLIAFTQEDPSGWLTGDREARGWRLLAVGHDVPPFLVGASGINQLEPAAVVALHAELRAKLRELVRAPAGQRVDIPTEDMSEALIRTSAPGERGTFGVSRSAPIRTQLFQEMKALILQAGDRFHACPACWEPFLALRKSKFCSPKCTQRWHDREKVKRKQANGGKQ
jgi:hypothetical protein